MCQPKHTAIFKSQQVSTNFWKQPAASGKEHWLAHKEFFKNFLVINYDLKHSGKNFTGLCSL